MLKRMIALAAAGWMAIAPVQASYVVKDGKGTLQTINADETGSAILPVMSPVDGSGNPFGVSNNPIFVAPGSGASFNVICTSGCSGGGGGGNVTIVGPLGQALSAVSLPVVLPAAQITALTPPTSVGFDDLVLVVPTITATAYTSGSAIGPLQTVAAFRTAAQPSGIFNNVFLQWLGTETVPVTFYVFNKSPSGSTTCTNNAAFVLASADAANLILPPFTLTASAPSVGSTQTSAASSFAPLSVKNKDTSATVNLYICAVSGASFTPAVGDMTLKIGMGQD